MTTPLDVQVSVFDGSRNTTPVETLPLSTMLRRIQGVTYRQYVTHLRQLLATQGKAPYDTAKRKSIAFTPAGVFAARANAKLATPSGLLNFDFDHPPDLATAKNLLIADPWIVYAFVSPSGDGLKVAVWAEGIVDDRTYKHAWSTVLEYFQRTYPDLAVANDKACKDIARLCYVSHDPDLYSNPDARLYAVPPYQAPAPKPKLPPRPTGEPLPADRRERYARQAIETAVQIIQAGMASTHTSPGTRHETQLKAARLLGGYVTGGVLSSAEAYAALEAAVTSNTDDLRGDMVTIRDGLHYGEAHPITLDQLEAERQGWLEAHRSRLDGHKRPAVPDMTGSPSGTQDAPDTLNATPRAPEDTPRFQTISARELYAKELPPQRWIVPAILPAGATLFIGRGKDGKSLLVWNLCLAVATGGMALSTYPVEEGDVLYLALEDGERRAQQRLKDQMRHAVMDAPPERLELVLWDAPRIGDGFEAQLTGWLDDHPEARLVVVDILEKVRPQRTRHGSVYADDYAALAPLQRLAQDRNIAILIVHHSNKTKPEDFRDSASGAMSLVGACDTFWSLRRVAGEPDAALHIIGRDVELQELAMQFKDGFWSVLGDAEAYRRSETSKAILAALSLAEDALTPAQLAAAMGIRKDKVGTLRKHLARMLQRDEIFSPIEGRYRPRATTPPPPPSPPPHEREREIV